MKKSLTFLPIMLIAIFSMFMVMLCPITQAATPDIPVMASEVLGIQADVLPAPFDYLVLQPNTLAPNRAAPITSIVVIGFNVMPLSPIMAIVNDSGGQQLKFPMT